MSASAILSKNSLSINEGCGIGALAVLFNRVGSACHGWDHSSAD